MGDAPVETFVERARKGEGPSLVDVETYRFHGHHEGEEQILGTDVYRGLDEIAQQRDERDPVQLARQKANAAGVNFPAVSCPMGGCVI